MDDVWLLQSRDDEPGYRVLRCDARTGEVVATVDVVEPRPMAGDSAQLAVGAGAVWIAAGHVFLYRVDPARNQVTAAVSVGHHLDGLVVTDEAVWISNDRDGGRLLRIDLGDNRIALDIPVRAHALAAGAGALWATWTRTITRVDLASLATQASYDLGDYVSEHAFGLGALWALTLDGQSAGTDHERSRLWRIDPATHQHVELAQLAGRPALAVGAGAVWLDQRAADDRAYLCRFDVATHALTRFEGARLQPRFTRGADEVWGLDFDGDRPGGALVRFRPSLGRAEIIGHARGDAVA